MATPQSQIPVEKPKEIPPFKVKNTHNGPCHMWQVSVPGGLALPGQVLEVPPEARAEVLKALEKGHLPKEALTDEAPLTLEDMIADDDERERQRLPGAAKSKHAKPKPRI